MCGLNVIIDKNSAFSPDLITRMNKATDHRGPDATGLYFHRTSTQSVFFGHNRLKIIDFSDSANQPFFSVSNRYLLLYNGEIYNYRELKQTLKKQGFTFRTESDTEVVLKLLIQQGEAGLDKLEGMFALVFYDLENNTLLAARDRFGQKPLFYAETDDVFIISSEIKAILATGLIKKELNEGQLVNYLAYKHARKPQTFFRNIYELEEGNCGIYDDSGWRTKSYLPVSSGPGRTVLPADKIVMHTHELLQRSVLKQIQADAPVGLFLSGGIDSTLLLALLAEAGYANFPAFSVVNQANERSFGSDDFIFSRQAAKQYGARHTVFEIDDSILKNFGQLIECMDQPIADGATLLTDFLSRQTHQSAKVALSGAGADELFGGYNRHRAFYQYIRNRPLLLFAKPFLRGIAPVLPVGFAHPLRKNFRLLRKIAYKIKADPELTFRQFTAMDAELCHTLKTHYHTRQPKSESLPGKRNEWLDWALKQDQHEYLISDILALTDQTSMRHSLEVRLPYLDNELYAFISSLRPDLLFKFGQKWILKELLNQNEGNAYINRSKEGFGMPIGLWLRKPTNSWLLEPLKNRREIIFDYLDFEAVQQLLYKHQKSKQDYSVELWALITLAFWLQKHFRLVRILYLHQYFQTPEQGGALRSFYLSQALVKAGHEVELITAYNGKSYKTETIEGVTVHYLPVAYANEFGFFARVLAFLKFSYQSTRLAFRLKNIDICFATSTPLTVGIPALLLKKWRGLPYYFEVRDLWPEAPIQLGYIRNNVLKTVLIWAEKLLYRNASKIIALSPGMVQGIKKYQLPVPVYLIPNIADCQFYEPTNYYRETPEAPFLISYIGTLGRANRLAFLLEAAAACLQKGLKQVKIVIAGNGAEESYLKQLAAEKELTNVEFSGHLNRQEVQQLLQKSDATYTSFDQLPVLETNSPNKFFDGLAAGKLSIVNTKGWLKELVENYVCGFYADPLQPETFAEQLQAFLNDPEKLRLYQENARELAETEFSRELLSRKFVALFD